MSRCEAGRRGARARAAANTRLAASSRAASRAVAAALLGAALIASLLAPPSAPPAAASDAAPLWPLAERGCVTGSFGEYRANHFHAGIDLSTGGQIGLPVRAPAAGRVVRLRASPYGYGRAIYIDLDDAERGVHGKQVVFGHLSDFAPRWRALVESEQERLGKYTVDFAVPDSPRVAAGEVVAFSGDTGAGPPHLHFEVRDGDATAIDPLVNGWRARDETPPAVRAVRLTPLGLDGRVDGGLDPVTIPLERSKKDGVFRPDASAAAPRLGGRVGVEVLAWDATAGCDAHRGVHAALLRLDGALLFATTLDRFTYEVDINRVNERYVYSSATSTRGRYLRLYDRVSGEGAIIAGEAPSFGAEPERALAITLTDPADNTSRLSLAVTFDGAPDPASGDAAAGPRSAAAHPRASASPATAPPDVSWRYAADGVVVRVERAPESDDVVVETASVGAAAPPGGQAPQAIEPAATVGRVAWYAIPRRSLLAAIEADAPMARAERRATGTEIRVRYDADEAGRSEPFLTVGPFAGDSEAGATTLVARTADAWLRADASALLGPALFATREVPDGGALPSGLTRRSGLARFEPRDPPLAAPIWIRFVVPDSLGAALERLAICQVSQNGGVDALDTVVEPGTAAGDATIGARRVLAARTRTLGTFALVEDRSPPRIASVTPANGKTITSKRPRFTVSVNEIGKGLDDEATRFTIDGVRLIPEYDPDAALITATPKEPLALGAHAFEVTIRDKAGHEATATSRFTVSAGATGSKKSKTSKGGAK